MYEEIYKQIKKYDNIVIARHIGVDPDAMCSTIALRDSIRKTFPKKKVYAVGSGSIKFNYIGHLDRIDDVLDNSLLIVLDTPDRRRVDTAEVEKFAYSIKIDHHPYIEKFCDLEHIDDKAGSACQLIIELIESTKLKMDENIAKNIFIGIVSDTNRFLFNSNNYKIFLTVSNLIKKYKFDIDKCYENLYLRSINEVKLQSYIGENMKVTPNKVGYAFITNDVITKYKVDSASAGNMINNFNSIEEVLVWLTVSEDIKNNIIRVSARSRGPIINTTCEKYHGGGHKLASGARVKTFEEALSLINDLDKVCGEYISEGVYENN